MPLRALPTIRDHCRTVNLVFVSLFFFHLPDVAPAEIRAQGQRAKLFYQKALRDGSVNVYRGRILLIGQDRAGKTSLKKSLLGLPFDPKEQSTDGIAVDPSKCEVEVDQIKPWQSTSETNSVLSDVSRGISRLLAEERYLEILSNVKEDLWLKESKVEVCTLQLASPSRTTNTFLCLFCWFL